MSRTGMLALALALACAPATGAFALGSPPTAQELADKAAIADLITSYYNNFGGAVESRIAEYYAEDGEMVLGQNHYRGIDAIKGAYAAVPADAPQRRSFALNILISNMLITVHGDTATARLVFTETMIDKQGDPPRVFTQGREFDTLVKRNGRWFFMSRQIMGANGIPDGWQD